MFIRSIYGGNSTEIGLETMFKIGDKVICSTGEKGFLTEGQVYTVEAKEPIWVKLKEDDHWWLSYRFDKVKGSSQK